MAIKKQEFYEGAALHRLVRGGEITSIRYDPPFFTINGTVLVNLKYSTRGRSPWGFTFTPAEQVLLDQTAARGSLVIALVCGSDGVAAIRYDAYRGIAAPRSAALRVACYRSHGEHYEVNGPDGRLPWKVSPSDWHRILAREVIR